MLKKRKLFTILVNFSGDFHNKSKLFTILVNFSGEFHDSFTLFVYMYKCVYFGYNMMCNLLYYCQNSAHCKSDSGAV
jgi:hypothetical protein